MKIQINIAVAADYKGRLNKGEVQLLNLVRMNKSHLVDERNKSMVRAMNSLEKKHLIDVKARPIERFGFSFWEAVLPEEKPTDQRSTVEQDFAALGGDISKLKAIPKNRQFDAIWNWLFSVKGKPKAVDALRRKINHLWATNENRKLSTVDPMSHVKLAADSIDLLRKTDVLRVLESSGKDAVIVAYYIARERPDLKGEVSEVMDEELKNPIYFL